MQYSVAKTRVIQNLGRGTTFVKGDTGDGAITTTAVDSWFNERARQLENDRNFWFMRTQTKYYLTKVERSCLYDFPIQSAGIGQFKYKSDLAMWLQQNVEKVVATFETGETWTGGAADTVNFKEGNLGRKVSPTVSATSYSTSPIKLDLTTFSDDSASTTADIIHFWVYLDNVVNAASYSLIVDCNAADYATDIYTKTVSTGLLQGWNEFNYAKSTFTRTGATANKDWSTVRGIKVQAIASSLGTLNATFDEITMVKVSPADMTLKKITCRSEIEAWDNYGQDDTGEPEIYIVEKNKFRLIPFPARSYILVLVYYGYLVDLSSDTDTNDLLNDYPDVLINGATADGFAYLQEYQDAQSWEMKFIKSKKDLEALDFMKKVSGDFTLEPSGNSGSGAQSVEIERLPGTYT